MPFKYFASCTVNHLLVPSAQTNFPVLVSLTNNALRSVANGGGVSSASGFDIVFSLSASPKPVILKYTIESYTATTGTLVAWVQLPTISATNDTVFYIIYGDPTITTSVLQVTPFDADFKAVYHLAAFVGSGSNANPCDTIVPITAGSISGAGPGSALPAAQVNGGATLVSTLYGHATNPGAFTQLPLTFSCWYRSAQANGVQGGIMGWLSAGNHHLRLAITGQAGTNQTLSYIRSGSVQYDFNTLTPQKNTWNYAAVSVVSGGNFPATMYTGSAAGSSLASQSQNTTPGTIGTTPDNLGFGARDAAPLNPYAGDLDELRYSTIARSADWLTTEYNTSRTPSTFVTFGAFRRFGGGGSGKWFYDLIDGVEKRL